MPLLPLVLVGCSQDPTESATTLTAAGSPSEVPQRGWQPLAPVRASFEAGEVVVSAPWPDAPEVGVSLVAWGAEGELEAVDLVSPSLVGTRQTYVHEGVSEWWERAANGLEQGFVVDAPPRKGPLVLELALRGAEALVDADGRSATFLPEPGGRLRYEGLVAWDADGTDLPAWMEATEGGLRLVVDTDGAIGPITVDPVLPGVSWTAEGNQAGAAFGSSVASAGDVNGDGFGDVVVGANRYQNGQPLEGAALVYLGSPAGLSAVPAWAAEGNRSGAGFAGSVASAGDVNGDGFGDVVVGAESYTYGQTSEGAAFVYLGSAVGLSAAAALTLEGNQASAGFGCSVASAGDVNGDGFGDVIVGAMGYDNGRDGEGAALLFLGSAAGLSAAPSWASEGNRVGAAFGSSVGSAGDVNGDGYADVVVGAPFYSDNDTSEGAVFLYLGWSGGLSAVPVQTLIGDLEFASFGDSVASAGDVNGDGYSDVVVGEHDYTGGHQDEGAAFVFLGAPVVGLRPEPIATLLGNQDGAAFGGSVASAGDVNADGFGDLLVGASLYDDGSVSNGGAAFLYLGSALGLSAPAVTLGADQASSQFGGAVASAGDVDGDGLGDLVIGATDYDDGQAGEGAAFVYTDLTSDADGDGQWEVADLCPGVSDPAQLDLDADGVGDACDDPRVAVVGVVSPGALVSLVASGVGPGERVHFGGAVGPGAAGPCPAPLGGLCLNLGAGALDLGSAVATASGVATHPFQVPAGVRPSGRYVVQAAIVRGLGGVDSVKSNVVVLDDRVLDWDADGLVDAVELSLGTDPTRADTDGDGLVDGEDLAPGFDPLEPDTDGDGVLDGSDTCWASDDALDLDLDGLPDACDTCPADVNVDQVDTDSDGLGDACDGPVLSALAWTAEGDQVGAHLGASVAAAGDVNGDGYGDVVVGGHSVDNGEADEGAAAVYLGSAAGLSAMPGWGAQGNQAYASFGGSVASAGDVNGDGYDDVVVGAHAYDRGLPDEGAAVVYLGSAAGLSLAPAWTAAGSQAYAHFGGSVASAGDVNGDGYDDVVVGADQYDRGQIDEGAAFLFLGSAAGLSAAPSRILEGGQSTAYFGVSVASAGDVNGDGYGDVVIGAYSYDYGQGSEGAAFVYLGSAAGLSALPAVTLEETSDVYFGTSVASAGDVNGDGYGDVAVGANIWHDGQGAEGAAFVYLGSAAGLSAGSYATLVGGQQGAYFGTSVASAGDVNGDGYGDVLVGASLYDDGQRDEGAAVLHLGSATGMAQAPAWFRGSDQVSAGYGGSVGSAGDVNGDGLSDVIIGAADYDNGHSDEGRASVYLGASP